ncbi:MAG: flagellar basal body P-ring protein FlgI [Leptospiraceae bacterium]|nr:flagellar basal body P-ring protein FlgI [Leptospiraceae bacterium]MCK6380188.1 flagellar basal body P-ring protein FlgI [Leptospiraceae bacterium]NUM41939.1 flagellar basal body P-ring protein FlgI [Leptospiraceae bacterium]
MIFRLSFIFSFIFQVSTLFAVEIRLKDIARIEGIRENQITGYGIVVGLSGTGDTKSALTSESMKNFLKNLGLSSSSSFQTRNIASVIITTKIPSYSKNGDRLDVTVSSIGDAKSLEGGVLVQSPLKSANGEVIAVASGVISFGGKEDRSQGYGKKENRTTGLIHRGAIVEREIQGNFLESGKFKIVLEDQDFSTLNTLTKLLEEKLSSKPVSLSPTEIEVSVPPNVKPVEFLANLENLTLNPESKARVVINERTGTIVMGANVAIDEVAISKQGLSLFVTGKKKEDKSKETEQKVLLIEESPRVSDIVDALNKIGASTKDIISILDGLKKAGALHAEVIIQ